MPPKHWFARASDASRSLLAQAALVSCGSLPRSVGLRCSPTQLPRQTGRSDLCSRHQRGSTGHSACLVIQLCRISQVYHQLLGTPDWRLSPPSIPPQTCGWWTLHGFSGYWAMLHGCASVKSQLSGSSAPLPTCPPKCSCLKLSVCSCTDEKGKGMFA